MNYRVERCIFLAKRVADQLFACEHARVQPAFVPQLLRTVLALALSDPENRPRDGTKLRRTGWVRHGLAVWMLLTQVIARAADSTPAAQGFGQEIGTQFSNKSGFPAGGVQLLVRGDAKSVRAFDGARWYDYRDQGWAERKSQETIG